LFLSPAVDSPHLHSFPTRRSSDLRVSGVPVPPARGAREPDPGIPRLRRDAPALGDARLLPRLRADAGGGPQVGDAAGGGDPPARDRKSTRLNSSHLVISYAVFCLK